jgi:hypothetical protein
MVALARLSVVEQILARVAAHPSYITVVLMVTAAIGIHIRVYLLSAVSFDIQGKTRISNRLPESEMPPLLS